MLLPLYGSHNASLKLREQIQWKDPVKAALWAEIVREKIVGQIAVLESEDCTEAASLLCRLSGGSAAGRRDEPRGPRREGLFQCAFRKGVFQRAGKRVERRA